MPNRSTPSRRQPHGVRRAHAAEGESKRTCDSPSNLIWGSVNTYFGVCLTPQPEKQQGKGQEWTGASKLYFILYAVFGRTLQTSECFYAFSTCLCRPPMTISSLWKNENPHLSCYQVSEVMKWTTGGNATCCCVKNIFWTTQASTHRSTSPLTCELVVSERKSLQFRQAPQLLRDGTCTNIRQ